MRYYCGFEFASREDWASYIPEIRAPSHYKDDAKIAAYINKRIGELEETANKHALAGSISHCIVIKDGEITFDENGQFVGTKFLEFLLKDSGMEIDVEKRKELLVVGCDITHALGLAAVDYVVVNGALPFSLHWTLGVDPDVRYQRAPGYINPASMLSGSSSYGIELVARRFGLPVNINDAESLAILSSQLAKRLGL